MFKKFFFLIVLSVSLSGCFFYEEYYESDPVTVTPPVLTFQQNCEKGPTEYMTLRFAKSSYKYKSLGFGEWQAAPKNDQFDEYYELTKKRAAVPEDEKVYAKLLDSLILEKEKEIAGIPKYTIHHIFSLKASDFKYKCFEGIFHLNKDFKVVDIQLEMDLNLDEYQYASFIHYMNQEELFCYDGSYDNAVRSKALYNYYNARLESGKVEKNEFMPVIIEVVSDVRYSCKFDENSIIKSQVKNFIKRYPEDYPAYTALQFSAPQELVTKSSKGADSLIGYRVFHSFTTKDSTSAIATNNCLYFEFDTYFMVAGALWVDPPFEKYFDKK